MTPFEWASILLAAVVAVVTPVLVLLVRLTVRWTHSEDDLAGLVADVKQLVEDKDRVHGELYKTMREDRSATDRRLRWLEENLWNRGQRRG